MAASDQVKEIACLYSANGTLPVYEICYAGKRIAFYLSRAGAPACIAGLEEIIAFGAKKNGFPTFRAKKAFLSAWNI